MIKVGESKSWRKLRTNDLETTVPPAHLRSFAAEGSRIHVTGARGSTRSLDWLAQRTVKPVREPRDRWESSRAAPLKGPYERTRRYGYGRAT